MRSPSPAPRRRSRGAYNDSDSDSLPERRERRSSRDHRSRSPRSPSSRGRPRDSPPYDYRRSERSYKILCVSGIHHKVSDETIRDTLYREFKKFGDVTVKIVHEPDERVAYVYFRSSEDARDAKKSKPRISFYETPCYIEPVNESASDYPPPPPRDRRRRSPSPGYVAAYGRRSPPPRGYERYDYPPPLPIDYRDPYGRAALPPPPIYDYRGAPPPLPLPYGVAPPPGAAPQQQRRRKEKFPNYLHHINPEDDPNATRTLFAGNLEPGITEDELRRIFGRYGIVEDVDIKRPPPGTGNAFSFIRFQNLDMAHRAKIQLSGQYIGKFMCKVGYGKPNPTTKVWVGGLGPAANVQLLEKEFDRFGVIKNIDFNKGENMAYITYDSIDAAKAAVAEMRGVPLGGPSARIRIDYAEVEGQSHRAPRRDNYVQPHHPPTYLPPPPTDPYYGADPYYRPPGYPPAARVAPPPDWKDPTFNGRAGPTYAAPPPAVAPPSPMGVGECRSIPEIAKIVPRCWEGGILLKNSMFSTALHQVDGVDVVKGLLQDSAGRPILLKVTQRLRLDPPKLEDVSRRLAMCPAHGIFVGLPTANQPLAPEPGVQARPLRNLIAYLKQKEAAGVISLTSASDGGMLGVLYAFPPCQFSASLLKRGAKSLIGADTGDDFLVLVVVRGTNQ
ncbi:unnamed protein product [Cyprideis torosa]|uniref:Uncharacterized protein n=1 Tax=Cyprideis torosa TaxID=163714 RepID=A0A7R8ZM99_9CRUS|nr:unnamed protein product [Cyprideis torosa]CAG0895099.1 unnamed protein product [Cyprideis torosa]